MSQKSDGNILLHLMEELINMKNNINEQTVNYTSNYITRKDMISKIVLSLKTLDYKTVYRIYILATGGSNR